MSSKDCVFCKIINNELGCYKVAENDLAIAFLDITPISVGHTLIIPKKHFNDFGSTDKEYLSAVSSLAKDVAYLLEKSGLDPWGFNYLSNQGQIAGQIVNHFHLHVIPKYAKNEGFQINATNIYIDKKIEDVQKKMIHAKKKIDKDKFNKKVNNNK